MRFDVPLISLLYGTNALAAALPRGDQRGSQNGELEQLEKELEQLEQDLEKELQELENIEHPHHNHGSAPSSYGSASASSGSTPASSASNLAGASASSSVLTSSISLAPSASSAAVSVSSVAYSLSSVAASLSSVLSSINATATLTASSSSLVASGSIVSTASNSTSSTPVASTSLVGTAPLSTAPSSVAPSGTAPSSSAFSGTAPSSAATFPAANSTAAYLSSSLAPLSLSTTPLGTAPGKIVTANSTSSFPAFTASSVSMAPTTTALTNTSVNSNITSATDCSALCSSLTFSSDLTVTPYVCEAYEAGSTLTVTGGQADVACGSTETLALGICRVTFSITTSFASETYVEVWMPNDNETAWNGRTISTDNGGLDGCVQYDQMQYLTGLGFAAFGDNNGHNGSAFDGTAFYQNNEVVVDWSGRARHESVVAGKQVVKQFYGEEQKYAYYMGCSAGGANGLHAAQYYPDDFDGIIAGSPAADMNHLQDWSARFVQLTGTNSSDPRFLTEDQLIFLQSYIFAQCDAALDGVDDGILEDPTICEFDSSAIPVCNGTSTDNCLTSTQIDTVYQIFTELYNTEGELLFPALTYGSQVDAFREGTLSGSIQGISHDWYAYAVYNNTDFDITTLDQTDYAYADSLDEYHGYPSSWSGDLSAFKAAGKKLIIYHGQSDPMVAATNSQRYYLKVAKTMGYTDNTDLDPFLRLFRISGMAHCDVGGIAGPGAWMFGQFPNAWYPGVAENIVDVLADWVENDNAPDTLTGTKFYYDEPSLGLEFQRPHCRFPYRTTYTGSGDWTDPSNWNCTFIEDWQECGVGAHPRLCNEDGSFN